MSLHRAQETRHCFVDFFELRHVELALLIHLAKHFDQLDLVGSDSCAALFGSDLRLHLQSLITKYLILFYHQDKGNTLDCALQVLFHFFDSCQHKINLRWLCTKLLDRFNTQFDIFCNTGNSEFIELIHSFVDDCTFFFKISQAGIQTFQYDFTL
ncbi:hypothetical protein D3C87_1443270 [compost metagenome]